MANSSSHRSFAMIVAVVILGALLESCDGGGEAGSPAGSLSFSGVQNFVVGEDGAPVAAVIVRRFGGSAGAVSAIVTPTGVSATGATPPLTPPADFDASPITVFFADGDMSDQIVVVPVLDDGVIEADETVALTLSSPTGGASLGVFRTATLTIANNDFAGAVEFVFAAATYGEDGSVVAPIQVRRVGGTAGVISAVVSTSDGTANSDAASTTEPVDYGPMMTTVVFGDGDAVDQIVPMTGIVQDVLPELNETVVLTLSTPTGGASIGPSATATLTIIDDDAMLSLAAPSAAPNQRFGQAVAAADGLLAIGRPGTAVGGDVLVFDPSTAALFSTVFTFIDPVAEFGAALAGSGSDLAIGQPGSSVPSTRVIALRTQALRFFSNGVSSDFTNNQTPRFGERVILSGGKIYIASPAAAHPGLGNSNNVGRVHIYDVVTNTLLSSLPESASLGLPQDFGRSMALTAQRLYVGAAQGNFEGTAWIYGVPNHVLDVFVPNPFSDGNGLDAFGTSVVEFDGKLFVGAPNAAVGPVAAGRVYIFDPVDGSYLGAWDPPVVTVNGSFGATMLVIGDRLVIQQATGGPSGAGRLFVFDAAGSLVQTIDAPNPSAAANFGGALCQFDGALVVGAPGADVGAVSQAGRAYIFRLL